MDHHVHESRGNSRIFRAISCLIQKYSDYSVIFDYHVIILPGDGREGEEGEVRPHDQKR